MHNIESSIHPWFEKEERLGSPNTIFHTCANIYNNNYY